MLTVVIECGAEPAELGASLASLVSGAVEGLVREVVVIDRGLDAAARKLVDHAGCRIAESGDLSAVIAGARGDWLLFIEPGARLGPGWIEAVTAHLGDVEAGHPPKLAVFAPARRDRPPLLRRLFARRTALAYGLLLPKGEAQRRSMNAGGAEALASRLRVVVLDGTIRPRPTLRSSGRRGAGARPGGA